MKFLVVFSIIVLATSACGTKRESDSRAQVNSIPAGESTVKLDARNEAEVRLWLAKHSYAAETNSFIQSTAPLMDLEEWEAEGKRLSNLEAVLRKLLRDRDEKVELPLVARALGWAGGSKTVPVLMDCLNEQSPNLRKEAASALGFLRDDRAVQPLIARLDVERDVNVRARIVSALGEIGGGDGYLERFIQENEYVLDVAKEALTASKRSKDAAGKHIRATPPTD